MIAKAFICICDDCTHRWYSETMPKQCAKCKTRHWNKTHGGWVYLAQATEPSPHSLVKIGWSSQPHVRMTALRDPDGKKVRMIAAMPCNTRDAESLLHLIFHQHRIAGEWFALSPELIEKAKQFDLFELPKDRPGGGYPMNWMKPETVQTESHPSGLTVQIMKPKSIDEILNQQVREFTYDRSESQE